MRETRYPEYACSVVSPERANGLDDRKHPRGVFSTEAPITFAPTHRSDPGPRAPSGDWTIVVEFDGADPVHLYVPRSQRNVAALQRGRQARFVDDSPDGCYDPRRHFRRREVEVPKPQSPIRRNGTLNSLATGPNADGVFVIGAAFLNGSTRALYSSDGPAVSVLGSSAKPEPDFNLPVETSRSAAGVAAAGALSGQRVRVRGTSFAAPQFARELVNRAVPATIASAPPMSSAAVPVGKNAPKV